MNSVWILCKQRRYSMINRLEISIPMSNKQMIGIILSNGFWCYLFWCYLLCYIGCVANFLSVTNNTTDERKMKTKMNSGKNSSNDQTSWSKVAHQLCYRLSLFKQCAHVEFQEHFTHSRLKCQLGIVWSVFESFSSSSLKLKINTRIHTHTQTLMATCQKNHCDNSILEKHTIFLCLVHLLSVFSWQINRGNHMPIDANCT